MQVGSRQAQAIYSFIYRPISIMSILQMATSVRL